MELKYTQVLTSGREQMLKTHLILTKDAVRRVGKVCPIINLHTINVCVGSRHNDRSQEKREKGHQRNGTKSKK
jgi:hypothetical protein